MNDNYIDKYYDLIKSVFKKCESLFLFEAINYKLKYKLIDFLNMEFYEELYKNSYWLNANINIHEVLTNETNDIYDNYINSEDDYNMEKYLHADKNKKSDKWIINVDVDGHLINGFKINNTFEIIIYINNGVIDINRIK